jgi:hypothetical protein
LYFYGKHIYIPYGSDLLLFLNYIASLENDKQIATRTKMIPKPTKTVKALMICGYLCQYFDFDAVRATKAESMTELNNIDKVSGKRKNIETRTRALI